MAVVCSVHMEHVVTDGGVQLMCANGGVGAVGAVGAVEGCGSTARHEG